MAFEDRILLLANRIELLLNNGMIIDPTLWDFMENFLGRVTPNKLTELVYFKNDSDSETIADLLFSPDQFFQEALEPSILSENFTETDALKLIEILSSRKLETTFVFPKPIYQICLIMPSYAIPTFIDQLHISRSHPEEVLSVVTENLEKHLAVAALVMLRNSRFAYTEFRKKFLVRFFQYFDQQGYDGSTLIQFVLEQLDRMPFDGEVMKFFRAQKQRWLNQLKLLRDFEGELSRSNIETLMAQGIKPPGIDTVELSKNIRMADRLFEVLE
jgi:hypothetical protein